MLRNLSPSRQVPGVCNKLQADQQPHPHASRWSSLELPGGIHRWCVGLPSGIHSALLLAYVSAFFPYCFIGMVILVEAAGIEPASESPTQTVLHA